VGMDRRRAGAAQRPAEHGLQPVVSPSPVVLFPLAVEGGRVRGISWVSDNLREMLGYSPADAFSPDWWPGNVHPEDREPAVAQTREHLFDKGRAAREYRFRHRDGTYRWTRDEIRLTRDAAGRAAGAVGSWSDITERRQLEEQF